MYIETTLNVTPQRRMVSAAASGSAAARGWRRAGGGKAMAAGLELAEGGFVAIPKAIFSGVVGYRMHGDSPGRK